MSSYFDVCIIGAGPGGLCALSGLSEPYSHDQLSGPQGQRAATALREKRNVKEQTFCVIDPEPWLSTWRRRFSALDIKWLRSPAMAHPDLFDQQSLLAFACSHGRTQELRECKVTLTNKLQSLEESHTGLWDLPSTQLFEDFCNDLITKLPHTFFSGTAASLHGNDGDFRVTLSDGRIIQAGTVVLTLGVPGPPVVPPFLAQLPETLTFHTDFGRGQRLAELNRMRVLVIGGGLTAVQAALLALKKRCKVIICSRRQLTTRHFDVDVSWFDYRHARRHHFNFFSKPLQERVQHIKAARGGGSVPYHYMEEVRAAVADGRLETICGEAQIKAVMDNTVEVEINGTDYIFDRIVNACGHAPNCKLLPLLNDMHERSVFEVFGGLPAVSQDLQLGSHKQLFVLGALASLEVGPDAGNLMGLRRAAQIVASVMGQRDWLKKTTSVIGNVRGNRYAALNDSESETDSEGQGDSSDSDSRSLSSQDERIKKKMDNDAVDSASTGTPSNRSRYSTCQESH
jgi:hypothetical protein